MRVLLFCNYDPNNAAMVTEHINAIVKYSSHDIFVCNNLVRNFGDINLNGFSLEDFDAIVIHYSIFIAVEQYLSIKSRRLIASFPGIKIVFLQDEYRFVNRSIEAMKELKVDVVFTCVPEHATQNVYPLHLMSGIRVVNTLTGYPSDFLSALKPKPLKKRTYHVSYRGRRYPDWHGQMGQEKFEIGEKFKRYAKKYGVRTNISSNENRRVYGQNWVNLIQNSRAVLGVESGASVFDFNGDISSRTETMRELLGKRGIRYDELRQRFFGQAEGTIDLAQISPRIFEAICLRTMCVLYEGNYSGILVPNVHYLPLKKDFSNIEYVCKRLRDDVFVAEITANAYAEIAHNQIHTYQNFVKTLDQEMQFTAICKRRNDPHWLEIAKGAGIETVTPSERQEFSNAYYKLNKFNMVHFPHGVKHSRLSVGKLKILLSEKLPSSLKLRIKSFFK